MKKILFFKDVYNDITASIKISLRSPLQIKMRVEERKF